MISRLMQAALRQRVVTVLLSLALIGLGVYSYLQLKVEAYPDIADTQVVAITQHPGHAAEEVEQQITIPIERALNSVPRVIARRSRTIFGLSVVELTFDWGTDDYWARQVVLERLRDADLPEGVTPTLAPLTTPVGELYRYVLAGGGRDAGDLRELQDWVVTPRLMQAPGVADVTPFGGLVKQYQVEVDPFALEKYGLSIARLAQALGANNRNAGGAVIDNGQQAMVVRGLGLIRSTAEIGNIVVAAARGVPVHVHDVGRVTIGTAPPTGIFGLNAASGGVEGIVLMRRGENASEVLKGVREAVEEINASRLPPGVRIEPIYDRSDLVANTLQTVSRTLLEGLLIVVTVLFLFLGSARAALLTAVTIPLSLLFAFVCMNLNGIPANLLSLGALDFGIIVDGSLIMVERIVHALSGKAELIRKEGALRAIREAALEVERPIFFSLVIIISAYLPLLTLQRVERRLFTPMAYTVCYALLGAMLLSLTLVPVLATLLFRSGARVRRNPALAALERLYAKVLDLATLRPAAVAIPAFAVVGGAIALGSLLGTEFIPQLDEGLIWIRANLPPGISVAKSAATANRMRAIIGQSPEVRLVSSQTGRNDSGTEPFGPNRNELLVALKPYDTWPAGMTKARLVERLDRQLNSEIPGASFNFTQPIIDMVTDSVTGSSADLAVIISGPRLEELRRYAGRALDLVRSVPGAADTSIEQEADSSQLQIQADRERIGRFGLNVADVQDLIEMAIGGKAVATLFEGERRFEIALRYAPEYRADPTAIGRILVLAPDGTRHPLADLASIRVVSGASIIARRENRRQLTVRTNIRGRDQGGFVADAQARFEREIKLPPGYRVEWGGQFENLERARHRLSIIMPLTVALIFSLLFLTFGSVLDAGLVLLTVPFSLVGGILALWVRGINLSVSAAVGFVSLFGVAVMSGVLVISEINRRRSNHPEMPLRECVAQSSLAQMRPVLMMVTAALLGMVPAARANGIGSDIQRPLATVIVGGLLSTLALALIALPALYCLTARGQRKEAP